MKLILIMLIALAASACAPTKVIVRNCVDLGAEGMQQCELIKKL